MRTGSCLDLETLRQLASDRLPAAEKTRGDEHLHACTRCAAEFETLLAPIASALHDYDPASLGPDHDRVQRLMEYMKRLPTPASVAAEVDATATASAFGGALSPPQAADEIGRLGPYRVREFLGAGGMGLVFHAEDPELQRSVALKVMRPNRAGSASLRERFLREARAAAALDHDNIVPLWQVGQEGNLPFLVMPLLRGETLAARLSRVGRLPPREVLRVGRDAAAGLAAAHAQSLVHRDVKPSNLWLEERPEGTRLRLLDFGLVGVQTESGQLTCPDDLLGTPEYMAPEQARGEPADARSDLFSLGCVLYEACTGQRPFQGNGPYAQLLAVALDQPTPPHQLDPSVPRGLSNTVMRLLAKRATERPATAAELITTFDRLIENSTTKPPRRWPTIAAASAAAILLTIIVVVISCGDGKTTIKIETQMPPERTAKKAEPLDQVFAIGDAGPEITNSIGMKLIGIPPGKFVMGSPETEVGRFIDPLGQRNPEFAHVVEITKSFFLGVFEVTQGEYEKVMGENPSFYQPGKPFADRVKDLDHLRLPADRMSHPFANEFCAKLSERAAEKKEGRSYRLPTEAEWEYACRAGTTTPFAFGVEITSHQANCNGEQPYTFKSRISPYLRRLETVGSYKANRWGLHDMHGNVIEMVSDRFDESYYRVSPTRDPTGPPNGEHIVARGGSAASWVKDVRSAHRAMSSGVASDDQGFRVVCEIAPKK